WVFDRAHKLFTHDAAADPDLHSALNQDKIIIFIHLLGLDTNGHTFKPYSAQYYNNIYYVDQGIKRIVDRIEDFYGHDASTAYIFTADHGMGDLGAHGDGHPDNTRTPLIAWGAGIAPARKVPPGLVAPGHDSFSRDWDHTTIERRDVNQADIAPLMAALIGVPFPLNSVGTLPLDYLDASPEFKAKAAFANAKQILAQYLLKHDQKRRSELHFVPYAPLHLSLRPVDVRLAEIDLAIRHRDYELAEHRCSELIQLCLEGLRYFQRYDWLLLRSIVSAGYIG
ncbi:Glycosyl phosphatidyl inositol anchor synthesis, partial [Spiromyces aspiralis]